MLGSPDARGGLSLFGGASTPPAPISLPQVLYALELLAVSPAGQYA